MSGLRDGRRTIERQYARIINTVKVKNKTLYEVWTGQGVRAGIFTHSELMERRRKYMLMNPTYNKNFCVRKDGTIAIKPMPVGDADIYLCERLTAVRVLPKEKGFTDNENLIGVQIATAWCDEVYYENTKNIYGLRRATWIETLDNFKHRKIIALKKAFKSDVSDIDWYS